jgi:hypothetical protein
MQGGTPRDLIFRNLGSPRSASSSVLHPLEEKMRLALALTALLVAPAASLELTPDNWNEKTAGKSVFIKFLAPW